MEKQKNIISENNFSTVVCEWTPLPKDKLNYQSERDLELDLLKRLERMGYQRILNPTFEVLKNNLRIQMSKLNRESLGEKGFSESEWKYVWSNILASQNDGVVQKTHRLQVENIYNITRDDGSNINIKLIDKKNIHNNIVQVFNQYEENDTHYKGRYDITILVNGLPMVHCELKRRGVSIKEAFNQIRRYNKDNFWGSSGLFEWVQIFIISNGTETKYFSNTTRERAEKENSSLGGKSTHGETVRKTSHSFEFTSYWADAKNRRILDLEDFAETFLCKGTVLNILTKYCVFSVDQMLLVMRPYQIVACENIMSTIKLAYMQKRIGTKEAGGFIWHTTGSGKTLTSFKAAQLATAQNYIHKTIFVVDRKDLDYQTIKEFEKFGGKESVSGNISTKILSEQLSRLDVPVIVTTIQKLNKFVEQNKSHDIYTQNCVIIFDECHRSQFGKMHSNITKHFKKYFLFGFTGTPIFDENSQSGLNLKKNNKGEVESIRTTAQIFGKCLHKYTIVSAINDGNVLPFKVDCLSTFHPKDEIVDEDVTGIKTRPVFTHDKRITNVAEYILNNFSKKTYSKKPDTIKNTLVSNSSEQNESVTYEHSVISNTIELAKNKTNSASEIKEKRSVNGFNSIFAVDSIASAKLYYTKFKELQSKIGTNLKIATIFSYNPNEDAEESFLEEEFETDKMEQSSRDFLENAISDYNKMFSTNWDSSADKFQSFYKDVSMRVKNREIDILIVVNMFLTGFDATTLNTLWVDKNLRYHGLIQAFSRTNRILNSQKRYGNIVSFRNLEDKINQACAMFGDKDNVGKTIIIRPFDDYYYGYTDDDGKFKKGYKQIVEEIQEKYAVPQDILNLHSEDCKKDFIKMFGSFLKAENILFPFDDFEGKEILEPRQKQDYQGAYLKLKDELRPKTDPTNIEDDLVFEIELIKQFEIDIDYILIMVQAKLEECGASEKTLELDDILSLMLSRPELRSKKELIQNFVDTLTRESNVVACFHEYVQKEIEREITEMVSTQNLKEKETREYVAMCLKSREVITNGTALSNCLPAFNPITQSKLRLKAKDILVEKIQSFLDVYCM